MRKMRAGSGGFCFFLSKKPWSFFLDRVCDFNVQYIFVSLCSGVWTAGKELAVFNGHAPLVSSHRFGLAGIEMEK